MCSKLFWLVSEIGDVSGFYKAEDNFSAEKYDALGLFGVFLRLYSECISVCVLLTRELNEFLHLFLR